MACLYGDRAGPVDVSIMDNNIELTVDARDRQRFVFERILAGKLKGTRLMGCSLLRIFWNLWLRMVRMDPNGMPNVL